MFLDSVLDSFCHCVVMTERNSSRSWSIAADTSVVKGSEGCGGEDETGGVAGKIEAGVGGE